MVAKKLIAFFAFVILITLLEQIKSGVHGRMAKPKKAGRVEVIHTGPRVRKLKKKVEELKKQLASMEPCEPCETAKKGGFLFESPAESDYIDAGKLGTPLAALTSCTWVKFKEIPDNLQVVFSLPKREFTLYLEKDELWIEVKRDDKSVGDISETIHFNEWSHYCVTKENDILNMYINGTRKASLTVNGGAIAAEGEMVYGKSYDFEGKNFIPHFTFTGEMAGINVWDRSLSEQEISEMSKSCSVGKGNVISMDKLKVMGGVQEISVTC